MERIRNDSICHSREGAPTTPFGTTAAGRGCTSFSAAQDGYVPPGVLGDISEGGDPDKIITWTPAFAGVTTGGLSLVLFFLAFLKNSFVPYPLRASEFKPVEISSATVSQPYDLLRGTVPPPSELSAVPWFGETLEYEVSWGFIDVGTSNLRTMYVEDFNGTPAVRIVSEAKSNSFCDAFYKVRDLNESWIDARNFSSLGYSKKLREGHFYRDEWVLFDYSNKTFLSKTTSRDGNFTYKSSTIPVPIQDILSSMYYMRTKPLKVGDEIIMDVNTKETWPLVVKVLKKESVSVPAGKFDCVVVEPFMRKEGIFVQKGRHLQVWMTDDARHIPVRMSVEVFFGHVTASLHAPPPPKP